MSMATTFRMTLLLIRYSLWPAGGTAAVSSRGAASLAAGPLSVSAKEVAGILRNLDQALDTNGRLHLHFPAAAAIAAPLLLFRLKRSGFSACRVLAGPDGLTVIASR
jgi:hypothetical protein